VRTLLLSSTYKYKQDPMIAIASISINNGMVFIPRTDHVISRPATKFRAAYGSCLYSNAA
jgi:hypothetical protein